MTYRNHGVLCAAMLVIEGNFSETPDMFEAAAHVVRHTVEACTDGSLEEEGGSPRDTVADSRLQDVSGKPLHPGRAFDLCGWLL